LSKFVAVAGGASRRKAAESIRAGRVRVDGEAVTDPALSIDPDVARVELDGRPLRIEPRVYIIMHKPRGPLSAAHDQRGRQTVVDLLGGIGARLYPAGRLDADTEGLLIITNDGDLTLRLTHPRHGVEKVYEAEVEGKPSAAALGQLRRGVVLDDGPAGPAHVRMVRAGDQASRVELTVHAGRKRMVRRMLKAVGHPVISLKRTRVGPLTLGNLEPGGWRHATPDEVKGLYRAAEITAASEHGGGESDLARSSRRGQR
jgi:pseudouridine synthase